MYSFDALPTSIEIVVFRFVFFKHVYHTHLSILVAKKPAVATHNTTHIMKNIINTKNTNAGCDVVDTNPAVKNRKNKNTTASTKNDNIVMNNNFKPTISVLDL